MGHNGRGRRNPAAPRRPKPRGFSRGDLQKWQGEEVCGHGARRCSAAGSRSGPSVRLCVPPCVLSPLAASLGQVPSQHRRLAPLASVSSLGGENGQVPVPVPCQLDTGPAKGLKILLSASPADAFPCLPPVLAGARLCSRLCLCPPRGLLCSVTPRGVRGRPSPGCVNAAGLVSQTKRLFQQAEGFLKHRLADGARFCSQITWVL